VLKGRSFQVATFYSKKGGIPTKPKLSLKRVVSARPLELVVKGGKNYPNKRGFQLNIEGRQGLRENLKNWSKKGRGKCELETERYTATGKRGDSRPRKEKGRVKQESCVGEDQRGGKSKKKKTVRPPGAERGLRIRVPVRMCCLGRAERITEKIVRKGKKHQYSADLETYGFQSSLELE